MNRSQLIAHYVALFMLAFAVCVWADMRAKDAASKTVAASEAAELAFWKSKLLPVYNDFAVRHAEQPKDREELFGPLVALLTRVERAAPATQPGRGP